MLIAALLTIVRICKQSMCPSIKNKENVIYIYICNEMLYSHEKEGNTAICDNMDLEGIILNEISQTYKDKYYIISLMCGI